jgi:hypothetical protein
MLVRRPDTVTLRVWSIALALPNLLECQAVTTSPRHDKSPRHYGNVSPSNLSSKLMIPIKKVLIYVTYNVAEKLQLPSVGLYKNNA